MMGLVEERGDSEPEISSSGGRCGEGWCTVFLGCMGRVALVLGKREGD